MALVHGGGFVTMDTAADVLTGRYVINGIWVCVTAGTGDVVLKARKTDGMQTAIWTGKSMSMGDYTPIDCFSGQEITDLELDTAGPTVLVTVLLKNFGG